MGQVIKYPHGGTFPPAGIGTWHETRGWERSLLRDLIDTSQSVTTRGRERSQPRVFGDMTPTSPFLTTNFTSPFIRNLGLFCTEILEI